MRAEVTTRIRTAAALAVVGLAGGWIALAAAGTATYPVGPFRVDVLARPGQPVTEIALRPFGTVRAETHYAPLLLRASLAEVDAQSLTVSLQGEQTTEELVRGVERMGSASLRRYVVRALVIAALGAAVLGALIFRRRWRPVLGSVLAALALFGSGMGLAWGGYRAEAFSEPSFTGSLALAPRLLGDLQDAPGQIDAFRGEVGRLVRGAVRAYGVVSADQPTESRFVVLHISDVHASPVGMDFAQELTRSFSADLVIDTGDITSFNTRPEREVLDRIPGFEVPYLFVRGNHDSPGTAALIAALPNARVLQDETAELEGLRVHGLGDPEFTPNNPERASEEERVELLRRRGTEVAERLAPDPPDILAVHDERLAAPAAGVVPLILSGHFHEASARSARGTILLRAGTAGGGGFDPFPGGRPKEISAQVLYLDGDPPRLVALDVVTLNPETRELNVHRTRASSLLEQEPTPAPTPTA